MIENSYWLSSSENMKTRTIVTRGFGKFKQKALYNNGTAQKKFCYNVNKANDFLRP